MKKWMIILACFCLIFGCDKDSSTSNDAPDDPPDDPLNETAVISGVVTDGKNDQDEPIFLKDTVVKVMNGFGEEVDSDITGEDGRYHIDELDQGTYFLFATTNDPKYKVHYWEWINEVGNEEVTHDFELRSINHDTIKPGDLIFTDIDAGLEWTINANGPLDQTSAKEHCESAASNTPNDWRLPSKSELLDLKSILGSGNLDILGLFAFTKTEIPYLWITGYLNTAVRIEEMLLDGAMDDCIQDYVDFHIGPCEENDSDSSDQCDDDLKEEGILHCSSFPLSPSFGYMTADMGEEEAYAICVRDSQ